MMKKVENKQKKEDDRECKTISVCKCSILMSKTLYCSLFL